MKPNALTGMAVSGYEDMLTLVAVAGLPVTELVAIDDGGLCGGEWSANERSQASLGDIFVSSQGTDCLNESM